MQAQVVAAVPLLTLAGLASSRMLTLAGTDCCGFRSERRCAVRLHLPAPTYGPASSHTFFLVRGEALPGQCEARPCDSVIVDEAHAMRSWGDQVVLSDMAPWDGVDRVRVK